MSKRQKPTQEEIKQSVEILTKFATFAKERDFNGAQKFLLKKQHELNHDNK